ncbi:hypothetical protein FISHEDRAFT_54404 [Fistulina hepatica ATCC 64428]|uniref:GPI-anchored wall transfer protein n=1 Tax=Fistulina hepatica ATCC 64428 TaxID=1128425 RepID=A0A0D7A220_9AGAR|nr:hypothetical protein FISHEDRAFT_54404 [Fistulina hepatica ATCC 64428]
MPTNADYKQLKEEFVQGLEGSSIYHVNTISSVALASVALHLVFEQRFPHLSGFTSSYIVLVVPLLLSITLFADNGILLSVLLSVPIFLLQLLVQPAFEHGPRLPSAAASKTTPQPLLVPLPALTAYRAHMLLLTCLAILAVDFPVFPRHLAKCETFGVSLMDLGVGSFVFSQGVVCAIPIIKDDEYLSGPVLWKLVRVLRKAAPVLALGIIRVLLVKGTAYPEHVTEYGVHWNFFITLASLPIMEVLLHPVLRRVSLTKVGIVVTLIQQFTLSYLGAQTYVLEGERVDLMSANKEGIVSLPGYLAVHLLGLAIGTLILPPWPGYFRSRHKSNLPVLCVRKKSSTLSLQVNMSYVLWVAAFNTTFILAYLLLDMIFASGAEDASPGLFDAINKNGLVLFLLANLLTGAVNLAIPTMHVPDWAAMMILLAYASGISWLAWVFRKRKLWRF